MVVVGGGGEASFSFPPKRFCDCTNFSLCHAVFILYTILHYREYTYSMKHEMDHLFALRAGEDTFPFHVHTLPLPPSPQTKFCRILEPKSVILHCGGSAQDKHVTAAMFGHCNCILPVQYSQSRSREDTMPDREFCSCSKT